MSQNIDRELGWDDEIEKDGGDFVLLPEGDYFFTVTKFERARFAGSEKMPPCNQAKLELTIHSQEHGDVTVFHNLFLHTKTEGLLSNFFTGIGQKKKGEKMKMDWNSVIGKKGKCRLEQNKYMVKGEERVNNQVKKFYPYDEAFGQQQPTQQQTQPSQTAQQNQAPFPTGQQQAGSFTPGQF
jgi:hypothetical protein